MVASTSDKIKKSFNSSNPEVTFVTSTRAAAATTMACDNLTGWPTDTAVDFVTYRLDTDGVSPVSGTQIDWVGIVSGSNITSLVRKAGAADTGNAVNDVVEAMPTATWANDLATAVLTHSKQDGTMIASLPLTTPVISSAALTTPKVITSLNDTNGNELFDVGAIASAVNQLKITNAATGNGPTLSTTGGDTNIDLNLAPKGTGQIKGIVDHLYNPCKWRVYRSAAYTGTSGVATALPYDAKSWDTSSNVDVVTNKGRVTATVAGTYQMSACYRTTGVSGQLVQIQFYKNGAFHSNGTEFVIQGVSEAALTVSDEIQLAVGDYVETYYFMNGGLVFVIGSPNVYFSGHLVSYA